jgi:hypothetical protein
MVPSSTTADRRPTVQSRGNDLSNLEAHGQKIVWDSSKDRRTRIPFLQPFQTVSLENLKFRTRSSYEAGMKLLTLCLSAAFTPVKAGCAASDTEIDGVCYYLDGSGGLCIPGCVCICGNGLFSQFSITSQICRTPALHRCHSQCCPQLILSSQSARACTIFPAHIVPHSAAPHLPPLHMQV